jgi:Animal haem peroxidase
MVFVAHGSAFRAELEDIFAQKPNTPGAVPLGHLFPALVNQLSKVLPDSTATVAALRSLAETMRASSDDLQFSDIPAGFTYFGQFVAHDMAFFDTGERRPENVPPSCDFEGATHPLGPKSLQALINKRSSQLQLDSLYSGATLVDAAHLRVGQVTVTNQPYDNPIPGKDEFNDVPRIPPEAGEEKGRAPLIGDPRNDNNLIVSQLHVAFLRAHNALVDQLRGAEPVRTEHFDAARKLLRQLYHHVLIHDYLKTIADEQVVEEVLHRNDPICDPDAPDFCLPLEFTVAAFRFGHAMVRNVYYYNDRLPLISFNSLIPRVQMLARAIHTPTLPASRVIEWKRFVARRNGNIQTDNPNFARLIGTTLVIPLFNVLDETGVPTKCEVNLAIMDLLRGYMLRLPTGQAIADELLARGRDIRKLTSQEVLDAAASHKQRAILADPAFGFSPNTPLWFYILAEAKLLGGGNKLGPVGSTIVAEVLIAFVRRSVDPILPKAGSNEIGFTPITTPSGEFKLPDLLRLGGVLS